MVTAERSPVFHQSVPLHHQIQQLLRGKIASGEWAPGERIPTEMALVGHFRVSRATLREALRALERDGLIARHRRRGTFVRSSAGPASARPTITNLVLGYESEIRVVGGGPVPAPAHVAAFLGVARGEPVQRFVRVEVVDGAPLAVVVNHLPLALGRRIRERDLARYSMVEILRDKLRLRLGRLRQQLEARMPDEDVAARLEIDVTQPVLLLRFLVYDTSRRPVQVVDTFYRADRYRHELDLPAIARRPRRAIGTIQRGSPTGGHNGHGPLR
ncbi:MAG: GntR family transcriptional regulator [Candidatus Rokuibacteriota bacterium]